MIGRKILHYRVLEKLGEGGMGEVFLAEDTVLRRRVALKFLPQQFASDPNALARFKREARTAASLNHPNIVTIHEIGEFEGQPYIAMGYVEGESLGDLIEREPVDLARAIDIALQICDGLATAHEAGIVHRDIKPHNILLDAQGRVKIVDFGLAKLGGLSKVTRDQSTLGTIYYMSPEQVRSEEVDHRSDIFSVGVVLYELLSGRLPFKGEHAAALVYSITNDDPIPLSRSSRGIPPDLDRVMERALAKGREARYQTIDEFADDLRRVGQGLRPASRPATRGNWLKILLPTSAVFLAVVLMLVFKPFRVEIDTDQPAVAAGRSLAVMYFKNFVDQDDPKRLGEIVSNLLITDLSETSAMEVVSDQRLYDILKLQGKEGQKVIDKTTATEVARHAGVKWMLLGSILQEEPTYIMTSQLVDVESGNVVASQRITGGEGEDIFALVDRLSEEIRDDLSVPSAAPSPDVSVASVTTDSPEAYRHYLEGVEAVNMYYFDEARQSFEQAVAEDSTFAMAYLRLAGPGVEGTKEEKKGWIEAAVRHADHATSKEQGYIRSRRARFDGDVDTAISELQKILAEHPDEKDACKELAEIYRGPKNDPAAAIKYYRRAIEIDPLDKTSYNVLAYIYQDQGDIDNYVWAIYQYISMAPDEANPYDTRGDLYAFSGKPDKALSSYAKAIERKPDFLPSIRKSGHMCMFLGNYEEAERFYRQLLENANVGPRGEARLYLALLSAYQGKLDTAAEELVEGVAADRLEGYLGHAYGAKLVNLSHVYAEKGGAAEIIPEAQAAISRFLQQNPGDSLACDEYMCYLMTQADDRAAARRTIGRMDRMTGSGQGRARYWFARGWLALADDQPDSAVACFERGSEGGEGGKSFDRQFPLAVAYVEAERYNDASLLLERLTRRFSEDRALTPVWAVKSYYLLGVAYQESGRPDKAAEQYELFLGIWKDADPDIESVRDARQRLAQLKVAG